MVLSTNFLHIQSSLETGFDQYSVSFNYVPALMSINVKLCTIYIHMENVDQMIVISLEEGEP